MGERDCECVRVGVRVRVGVCMCSWVKARVCASGYLRESVCVPVWVCGFVTEYA